MYTEDLQDRLLILIRLPLSPILNHRTPFPTFGHGEDGFFPKTAPFRSADGMHFAPILIINQDELSKHHTLYVLLQRLLRNPYTLIQKPV
jgi:hypothetical protein